MIKRRTAFWLILILFNLLVFFGSYFVSVLWRSASIYNLHHRWIGTVYHLDKKYGYFPTSNAVAYHSLEFGERIPVQFDRYGFRVPYMEHEAKLGDYRILFLGDSFTHGYGVPAEKTFAFRTGKQLGASAMNAGVSGWGLSQILLRARDVIPEFTPHEVVVQYSTWLPNRSMRFYQSRRFGKSPNPYFYENGDTIAIHPPAFQTIAPDLPISQYSGKGKSLMPFILNIGLPLFVHDDYVTIYTSLRSALGILPYPVESHQVAADYAYQEILRLCKENGANMTILVLPQSIDDVPDISLNTLADRVIAILPYLKTKLPQHSSQTWDATFKFVRNGQTVDHHPNAAMHAYIAEQVIESIRPSTYENNENENPYP